jgi:hypothetical protein
MRRWLAALVCTTALAASTGALAGCTADLPAGVDGDLTNRWNLPPAAVAWQPMTGKCFDDVAETSSQDDYAPISCAERHVTETYAVGTLTGSPASARAGRDSAYAECAKRADAYVGGAWRTGRLLIQPVLPDDDRWADGARWYRCDVAETGATGDVVGRDRSLLGALKHEPELLLRCADPTVSGESVRRMTAIDCARPHRAEFAGLWTAPEMSLTTLEGSPQLAKGCLSVIARYTGVPNDSMLKYRTGWLGFPFGAQAWTAGDRTVQCFLWLSGETMTGSYKGAGPAKLKIHYA